jgi:hypothetical protein
VAVTTAQKHKPAEYVRRVPKKVEKVDAMKGNILLECKKIMTSLISDAVRQPPPPHYHHRTTAPLSP